jgi:hypothetical protein
VATIYIEESGTPIYTRIASALGAELASHGQEVLWVKPKGFNQQSYLQFLQMRKPDSVYVSNAGSNAIQGQIAQGPSHFFEHFPGKLIFLHQDAVLSGLSCMAGLSRLQAWQRVDARAYHLCIEPDSVQALLGAGITHASWVPHATEIPATVPEQGAFEHQASFVGHVVPSNLRQSAGSAPVDALMNELFFERQQDMGVALQPAVAACSAQALSYFGSPAEVHTLRVAHTQWLRTQTMHQSLQFRGWVFENAGLPDVKIFGGDPAYLHGVDRSLRVQAEGVSYEPAMYELDALRGIFRNSAVNVNVSSLQFDHAVVNRFHDVTMAGGLCLTDYRDGIADLTRHHAQVSFRTLAELHDKVRYFSDPAHRRERALLIEDMQRELAERSGYPYLSREILSAVQVLSSLAAS